MRNYTAIVAEMGQMPSRYMCDVLDDMRKQYKTRNFSGLMGAIEQLQTMAYRMEAALGDKLTIEEYDEKASSLGRDLKTKRKVLASLKKEVARLEAEKSELTEKIKRFRHKYNKETKDGGLAETICCDRYADNMPCDCPK